MAYVSLKFWSDLARFSVLGSSLRMAAPENLTVSFLDLALPLVYEHRFSFLCCKNERLRFLDESRIF